MQLPPSDRTLLVRTDFSGDAAWRGVVAAAQAPSPDGFQADLHVIDDRGFDGADSRSIAEAAEAAGHVLLIIADRVTMADADMTLLCIDPISPGGQFRTVPDHLWLVENNVSLANMDFAEFVDAADPDGVFRGFKD